MSDELYSSRLGTKLHWDNVYEVEVKNHQESGEEGYIWCGEDAVEKIIDWSVENQDKSRKTIDIGMGNGHVVFELIKNGFKDVKGVDYSVHAVELARNIQQKKEEWKELQLFEVMDVLDLEVIKKSSKYEFALDKGTFDAISLGQVGTDNVAPADRYVESLYELLVPGGILLLTCVNWTSDELISRFAGKFCFHDKIKYPTFKFGGVQGQSKTTVALKRI